ncbi:hypothetical protein SCHPADRAFT_71009 [Schizopora paradoxa]|uniref:Peptidase C14 caspase domain-containing protein n=1 Tax=Schizopora paradoxa TaxID=27342 RepID=A0A0H2SQF1_9AGAM|nr:hypothetical protein SCHPADRAFT_71009 [Schizopora paradoxa]
MITSVIVLQNAVESAKGPSAASQLAPFSEYLYLFGVSQSWILLSAFSLDHHHPLLAARWDYTATQNSCTRRKGAAQSCKRKIMASVSIDGVQAQTQANATERTAGQKRKALLIGVQYADAAANYSDNINALRYSHNDVTVMKSLLGLFGFAKKDVRVMLDVPDGKHENPTRDNIAMKDLICDSQAGDHYVFYFSGHGSQVPNKNQDKDPEEDGMDEAIWPADVRYDASKPEGEEYVGAILDDDLKKLLVDDLNDGAHLTVILDCCHSGTGVDLPSSRADETIKDFITSPISPDNISGNSFASYDPGMVTSSANKSESQRGAHGVVVISILIS